MRNLKFKSALLPIMLLLCSASAMASHPQLLIDKEQLAFIRAKAGSNSQDWQAMKAECDMLASDSVRWPSVLGGGNSPDYVYQPAHPPKTISSGYFGSGFLVAIQSLGACYLASKPSDPAAASRYAAQAHNIIAALSQPPLTVVRKSDGLVLYGHSADGGGKSLRAGESPSVLLYAFRELKAGDAISVSGAKGCTSLNGAWTISSISSLRVFLAPLDGSAAPPLNADCALYSVEPISNLGYGSRFWMPALAIGYDWFYDELSAEEKANCLTVLEYWSRQIDAKGFAWSTPESNYYYGHIWGSVAAYVAADGDAPQWTGWLGARISDRILAPAGLRDYHNRWLAGGGYGEGWSYGSGAVQNLMSAELAMKLHGTDWSQPPYSFTFVDDTLRYWMQFTTPGKLALDENEYVYPMGVTEPTYIQPSEAIVLGAIGRRFHSPYAGMFQSWYADVSLHLQAAAGKEVPPWSSGPRFLNPGAFDVFFYQDPAAPVADWRKLPLMYRGWGGDYAVTRTDWSDSAVYVTLLGGPSVGSAGGGHTQFDSGAVTIQRGNNHLLVYGLGEASRSHDIVTAPAYSALGGERQSYGNKKNSIFWAGANASEMRNQGLGSRQPPPGLERTATSWGSSIDRAEDTSAYTYWRAAGLEANNAKSSVDGQHHQTAWTREVFFLRPKLVLVHDRTSVLKASDDRAIFWTFGRNLLPVTAGVPAGVTRFDICRTAHNPPLAGDTCSGPYRGAFWSLLPASPSTLSVVDHNNLHFLYRAEVRPAANDHLNDNWMAAFDAADTASSVLLPTALKTTGADAVQFNDANRTVIAFPQAYPPSLPITLSVPLSGDVYLAGMAVNTAYKVTSSGGTLTIAGDDGSNRLTSSPAGVLFIPAQLNATSKK